MDEKDRKPEERNENKKLEWSVPKLLFMQKNKTEGGASDHHFEEVPTYYNAAS